MTAASFFADGTHRDRTLVRNEPRSGIVPPGRVEANGDLYLVGNSPDGWLQASLDDVRMLTEVR